MKLNKQLLFSILFALSILVGAVHNLEHSTHSSDNCSICTLQSHTDSADLNTPAFVQNIFIPFEMPHDAIPSPIVSKFPQTLFSQGPPTHS